ncbi:MAG: phosphatidate cytidylyltransferase [Candidatus Omnitrophica bacterium]|nr:phosphatidate cytidylyltransferase [Candidatus Omnitrophota bacterium]
MFIKRLYSSIILCLLVTVALFSSLAFYFVVVCFVTLALYEFFTMLERRKIPTFKYFGTLLGVIIPITIMLRFELTKKWELFFIVLALFSLFIMQLKRQENEGAVISIATTLFGILYVSWFFSFVIRLRMLQHGLGFVIMLLIITKFGDIGAYLVGKGFGKHPLIPHVSPNKSIEGALGGLVFSMLGTILVKPLVPFSLIHLFLIGLVGGILAQLGDLFESLMKRDCLIKDSSDFIPGIGGVLDLIDSILFVAPALYFYAHILLGTLEM